ncbi:MAG: hypothetical protein KF901_27980 [Myxococcales bacterium]|nr:hypothetical protein [Myxococcales bacterium]
MGRLTYAVAIDGEIDEQLSTDLLELEVSEGLEAPSTCSLRLLADACDARRIAHVDDPRLATGREGGTLTLLVEHDGATHCLLHGVITERRATLRRGVAGSSLEIVGEDRTVLLDRLDAAAEVPEATEPHATLAARLLRLVFSDVEVTGLDRVSPDEDHPLRPTGSVRDVLGQLAGLHGVRFFVRPSVSRASQRVVVRDRARLVAVPARDDAGVPRSLVVTAPEPFHLSGGESCRVLDGFEVQERGETRNRGAALGGVDLRRPSAARRDEVDGPATRPVGGRALGAGASRFAVPPSRAGGLDERAAALQSALDDDSWFLRASAETSVDSYGALLRPADVVEVLGAGVRYGGAWLVRGVEHRVDRTGHRMRLDLVRNAIGED